MQPVVINVEFEFLVSLLQLPAGSSILNGMTPPGITASQQDDRAVAGGTGQLKYTSATMEVLGSELCSEPNL